MRVFLDTSVLFSVVVFPDGIAASAGSRRCYYPK